MSEVKTIGLLFFAAFSIGVGATFMHQSVNHNDVKFLPAHGESMSCTHEAACQRLVGEQQTKNHADIAKNMYIKAFELSFSDQLALAHEAAECAAHLNLGHHGWTIESIATR